ncbi:MAG: helix-hairpin-helix domain-containing protein, partial [Actinomycetota bacterium]
IAATGAGDETDASDTDASDDDAADTAGAEATGDAGTAGAATDSDAAGAATDAVAAPELDLGAAAAVLGTKVKLDDLTAVEGIGPKIAELCAGIGVTTWRSLADTEVATLQSMLDDAGSRYRIHDPGTWPRQAGLLAAGAWAEFKQLTDELDGGR